MTWESPDVAMGAEGEHIWKGVRMVAIRDGKEMSLLDVRSGATG